LCFLASNFGPVENWKGPHDVLRGKNKNLNIFLLLILSSLEE